MNNDYTRENYNEMMETLLGGILDDSLDVERVLEATEYVNEPGMDTNNRVTLERLLGSLDQTEPTPEPTPTPTPETPVGREIQEPRAPRATRRATPRATARGNDYGLAWEIYSLGYSTGDVSHLYKSSAGSISRGIKKDERVMRTGAETKAMRKTDPDSFSLELVSRINELLDEKYETAEERNSAFYRTFNKNLYEITMYEAEDEQVEIESMHERATIQGISLSELARQQLDEQAFVERERSVFVNKVRNLHQTMKDYTRDLFGDVNVGVGAVDVQSKVRYGNGIVLTVKEAYKIDGKAMDATNVAMTISIADYIVSGFERELEQLAQRFNSMVRASFTKDGEPVRVVQLGNRMVVGLENE